MNKHGAKLASNAAAGTRLTKAASRLLLALDGAHATAIPDPTREDALLVKTSRAGMSLGCGTHPAQAGAELLRHDLVERAGGSGALSISAAGRSHLRRRASELGTPFQDQQLDLVSEVRVEEAGERQRVVVNTSESPLAWLARRRDRDGEPMIDPASYEAGERLRRDLTLGGVMPSITARWDGGIGNGGGGRDPAGATDAMIAARQRVTYAMRAVGSDFADLLIDLCGFLKGLEQIERERRWPSRSGKVVVRLALWRLAEHYGLETVAHGPGWSRGIRSWVDEGSVTDHAAADTRRASA